MRFTVQDRESGKPCDDGIFLMLDFDGTLVPAARHPDHVVADDELTALLERLRDVDGVRVAVVSGRSLNDLEQRLRVEGLMLVGSHGGEVQRTAGGYRPAPVPTALHSALDALQERLERRLNCWPGCFVERKSQGIALHYRCASAAVRVRAAGEFVSRVLSNLRQRPEIRRHRGQGNSLRRV